MAEKLTPEEMINRLELWEATHLVKLHPKVASTEFGQVSDALRKIGERVQLRLNKLSQNKCFICEKPLEVQRIFNTRAVFEVLLGHHVNRYACSPKCDGKLEELARSAMTTLRAE